MTPTDRKQKLCRQCLAQKELLASLALVLNIDFIAGDLRAQGGAIGLRR